jgi:hypothetical protein
LAEAIGLGSKTGALKRTLRELIADGRVAYTLPDKPTSRLQRYRLLLPHGRAGCASAAPAPIPTNCACSLVHQDALPGPPLASRVPSSGSTGVMP